MIENKLFTASTNIECIQVFSLIRRLKGLRTGDIHIMKVHFDELGNPDDKTIIFVHGAGGSSATWFLQLRGLSEHLHVVAIDLNGHGKSSDRNEPEVVNSYLDDIDSVVKLFDEPILGGHSMGGALTQLYTLENPHAISGAILIATGSKLRVAPMIFDLLKNDFESYIQAVAEFMFHETASEKMVTASQVEVRKCPPEIIARDFRLCDEFNIMSSVKGILIPTLILVGAHDQMTPMKYSKYMLEEIKGAQMKVIDEAGHSIMLEQSAEFNKEILQWTQEQKLLE